MSRPAASEPLPIRRQVALSAYWFSLNFETASLLTIVVPAALDRLAFHAHVSMLARLAVLGSVVAMVLPPLAGSISDRTHRRGGQRRPMLLWGTAINVFGLFWMLSADSVTSLGGGFLLAVLGQNFAGAAYQAMMPDVVPRESWGLASGYMGVASLLGTIGGLVIAGLFTPQVAYLSMALFAVVGAVYSAGAARGEEAVRHQAAPRARIKSRRDFLLVFAARFLVMFGQALLNTFILYFFQDVLHASSPKGSTAMIGGLALVGAVLSAFMLGNLSDRSDRPGIVFFASIPMAIAAGGFGLLENVHWIFLFAILYGVGYGAYLSVDWALALDSIPDLSNVARDLGVWGIASNLPAVLAPAAGGLILTHVLQPAAGYRELFLVTGAVTMLGALLVLFVRTPRRASFADIGLRLGVALLLFVYVRITYRVRIEGRLLRRRGATLVVSNHAHDLEGMVLPVCLQWQGRVSQPVYSAGSERLFEPGFLTTRAPQFFRPLLAGVHVGKVLTHLGVRPIENMPRSRPFVGLAYAVWRRHGNLPLAEVFTADTLLRLGIRATGRRLRDAWRPRLLFAAQTVLPFTALKEPYRAELRADVRRRIEAQIDALAGILDKGGTLYLTPEGRYTENGALSRLRESLVRLRPHAEQVMLSAVSYDPFAPGRLRLLVRLVPLRSGIDLRRQLLAARTVTASQLVATTLLEGEAGSIREVAARAAGLRTQVAEQAALAPDLARDPERTVRRALVSMVRRGVLRVGEDGRLLLERRQDPRFDGVEDMVSYQAAHFSETCTALESVPASLV